MIIKILKPNLLVGYEDWKTDVGHCTWTNEFVTLVVYGDWKTDVGHCLLLGEVVAFYMVCL